MTDERAIANAEARQLWENPLLQAAFANVREDLIDIIETTVPNGSDQPAKVVRDAANQLHMLRELKYRLRRYMADADVERINENDDTA